MKIEDLFGEHSGKFSQGDCLKLVGGLADDPVGAYFIHAGDEGVVSLRTGKRRPHSFCEDRFIRVKAKVVVEQE